MIGSSEAFNAPFDVVKGVKSSARVLFVAIAAMLAIFVVAPASASAAFNIPSYSNSPSTTAAGANVTYSTSFSRSGTDSEDVRNVDFHLPAGATYSLAGVPRCSDFWFSLNLCPSNSVVGKSTLKVYTKNLFGSKVYSNIDGTAYAMDDGKVKVQYVKPFYSTPDPTFTIGTSSITGGPSLSSSDFARQIFLLYLVPDDITISNAWFTWYGKSGNSSTGVSIIKNPTACGSKTHALRVTSYQNVGVTKTGSYTLNPCAPTDQEAPVVSITAPASGTLTADASIAVDFTASDNVTPSGSLTCDHTSGANKSLNLGDNTITVSCTDAAGNTGTSAPITVTRGEAPVVTINSPADNTKTTEDSVVVDHSSTGTAPVSCTVAGDTGLVLGNNTVSVTCTNAFGSDTKSVTVIRGEAATLDNLASSEPVVPATTTASSTTLTWTNGGTAPVSCTYSNSNGGSGSIASGDSVALGNGSNVITVTCDNGFGAPASASVSLNAGIVPLVAISSPSNGDKVTSPVTVNYSVDGGATPVGTTCTVNGSPSSSNSDSVTLPNGDDQDITVVCVNSFGTSQAVVSVDVGTAPEITSYASSAPSPTTAASTTLTWTATGNPTPSCTVNGTAATSGTSFPLSNGVNTFDLACSNGFAPAASASLSVTKNEAPGILGFASSVGTSTTASSTVLSWATTGSPTPTCTVNGTAATSGTSFPLSNGGNTFNLVCSNGISPNATDSITVTKTEGAAISNFASSESSPTLATSTNLSWTATGNPSPTCTINGTAATSGASHSLAPGINTFNLSCSNGIGSPATASLSVTRNVAPAVSGFASSVASPTTASSTNLSWTATGYPTPTCTVNGTAATSGASHSLAAGINAFNLSCSNGVGSPATSSLSVTRNVAPAVSGFASSESSPTLAANTTLTWTATGYPSPTCTINGTAATSGTSFPLANGTNTFNLSCSNGVGSPATGSLSVTKNQAPAVSGFASSVASPTTATSTNLSWTATGYPNPTCTVNGTAATSGASHSLAAGINTFNLSCSNGIGSPATSSLSVTRNVAPAISGLASSAGTTTGASSTVLTWTATGYPTPTCTVNGTAATSGTSFPLANGGNTFNLVCSNGISPNATDSITVTKNQDPSITNLASSEGTTTQATSTTLTWTLGGSPTPTCTVNGTAASSGVSRSLNPGDNVFTVVCGNGVGPNDTEAITVTRNVAPAITTALASSQASPTTSATTNLTWAVSGYPAPTCKINGGANVTSPQNSVALAAGPNTFNLVCTNGVGADATGSVSVTRNVAPAITTALASSQASPTTSATTNLTWAVSGYPAPTCKINGGANVTSPQNSVALAAGTNSFNLVCTNGVGADATGSVSVTRNVAPAITTALASSQASPTTSATTNLTWAVSGYPAPTCKINGGANVTSPQNGVVLAPGPNTFNLVCTNGVGADATGSVSVTRNVAPAISGLASSAGTTTGASSTVLTWTATGHPTPTCTVNGTAATSGTSFPLANGGNTFNLVCSNGISPNATDSITVTKTEGAAISNFASSESSPTLATSTNLSWTATGNPSPTCTINGTAATSGASHSLAPGINTFNLSCSNGIGSPATASLSVTRNVAPAVSGFASSVASPTTASSTNLSWTATGYPNPTCTVNGTAATSGASHSLAAGINAFNLSCSNGVGSPATSSLSVTRNVAPAVSGFASSESSPTLAANTTLTWTATGYPSPTCTINGTAATSGTSFPLANGTNTFNLSCSNGVGSPATGSLSVTKNQAPAVSGFASSVASPTTATSTNLSWTATGYPNPTCTVNGTAATSGASHSLAAGINTFNLSCSNGIGSPATSSLSVTRNVAPAISGLASSAGTTTGASSTVLTWTATGYPTPTCTVNGTAATSGTSFPLANGGNTFNLVCSNGISPNATDSITVTKNQDPSITNLASSEGTTTQATSTTLTWTLGGSPTPTCTVNGTAASSGVSRSLNPGDNVFTVVCGNGVGPNDTEAITVTRNVAPAITTALASSQASPTTSATTNLTWAVSGYPAPTCKINGGANVTSPQNSVALAAGPNTFNLVCTNGVGADATGSVSVTRNVAPAVSGFASSESSPTLAANTTLTWTATGYPSPTCTINGTAATSGTSFPLANGTNTFNLSCSNGVGSPATGSLSVTKNQAPAVSGFASSVASPTTATSTNLSWTATGYPNPTCTVNGTAATSGASHSLAPGINTFNLSCSNGIGSPATASLSVTRNVAPAVSNFASSESSPTLATSTNLSWTATGYPNPTCTVNGTAATSGASHSLAAGINTFNLSCSNGIGSPATASLSVTRNAAPAVSGFASSVASPTTASSTNLSWTATGYPNPTCTVNGTAATSGASHSLAAGINAFNLSCSNGVGSPATSSLSVTRNVAPAITTALASSQASPTTSATTNLTWAVSGYPAPTCKINGGANVTSPQNSVALAAGPNTFNLVCTNGVGADATGSVSVTRNVAPAVSGFASSESSPTLAANTTLTWTATGYPSPTCTINGTAATSGTSFPLANGTNTFNLSCSNGVGSPATGSLSVTKNEVPSITSYSSSESSPTNATSTNLSWTVNGYPAPTCTVNGTASVSGVNRALAVGSNTFNLSCSNGVGSPDTDSITIVRNAAAVIPDTTITEYANPSFGTPPGGTPQTNSASAPLTVQFNGTETPTSYQCAVVAAPNGATSYNALQSGGFAGVTWSTCSSTWTVPAAGLASPAQYVYIVRAVNAAGPDPTPAKGFFWKDDRNFTAAPTLEYFTNTLVTNQADTNNAGAHPTLGMTLTVEGYDDGKSVNIVMPDGLMGSLAAIPEAGRCTWSGFQSTQTCPATSKLGTIGGFAVGSVDGGVSATGTVYLIEPDTLGGNYPGAAAAVAAVIDNIPAPYSGNAGKIAATGGMYINDNGFNLRISIPEIPNETSTGLRFHANSVELKLDGDTRPNMGQPASATNPALITNPSQCPLYDDGVGNWIGFMQDAGADRPNWYRFAGTGTGHNGSTTPKITVDYPVDNCEALDFSPSITMSTSPTPIVASTSTVTNDFDFSSEVNFNYGDSTLMSTLIYMPPYISTNLPGLGDVLDQCANATMVGGDDGVYRFDPTQSRGCPSQARVGTADIISPMIDGVIHGDVWLIESSPIPSIGITVRDTTSGNPRGVNVGFVLKTNTVGNEYPTGASLAPFAKSACSVRTPGSTNNRRVDTCRTAITASVSPGGVPDMPLSSLSLTIGNVSGRIDINGNPMSKPLRTATDTDPIACRIGGVSAPNDWLPPSGSTVTPASSAFRMPGQADFLGWSGLQAPSILTSIPIVGCTQ